MEFCATIARILIKDFFAVCGSFSQYQFQLASSVSASSTGTIIAVSPPTPLARQVYLRHLQTTFEEEIWYGSWYQPTNS